MTNPIALLTTLILTVSSTLAVPTPDLAIPEPQAVLAAEQTFPSEPVSTEGAIRLKFHEEPELAVAIFTAESNLNPRAQGWNCRYDGKSKPCRREDRDQAWSVDCGVAQNNLKGNQCPEYAFDLDWNLTEARKKYDARKWQPWSAYKNGAYRKYLK